MAYWRTISVSPLPPGWVTVWENEDGTFWTEPCPALLLQELDNQNDPPPDTRVVPACSVEGVFEFTDPDERCGLHTTTTADEWERNKPDATTGRK